MRLCRFRPLLFICVYLFSTEVIAQAIPARRLVLTFEKLYLHTDREHYKAGEDIWYKAYLLNGQTDMLTASSDSLNVSLLDEHSEPVLQQPVRLRNGLSKGDFRIPENIPGGRYILSATTAFTSHLGTNLRFEKPIYVYNEINTVRGGTSGVITSALRPDSLNTLPLLPKQLAPISFYPEGGSLIEGVEGVVAFRASDKSHRGQAVTGTVSDQTGRILTNFSTDHSGMGKFILKPVPGFIYTAKGKLASGEVFSTRLPGAIAAGISINTGWNDSTLVIRVLTNETTLKQLSSSDCILTARSKGKNYYTSKLTLNNTSHIIEIKKAEIPAGVSELRLSDGAGKPQSERLVYNNRANRPEVTIARMDAVSSAEVNTTVLITIQKADGKAAQGNLSISVTDETIPVNEIDFVTYLELRSEIKGQVENIRQYFDPGNKTRLQDLDLLLMTRGWRDFLWRRIVDTELRKGKDGTEYPDPDRRANFQALKSGVVTNVTQTMKDSILLNEVTVKVKEEIRLLDQKFRPFKTDTWLILPKDYDHKNLLHYLLHYTYGSLDSAGEGFLIGSRQPRLVVDGYSFPFTDRDEDAPIKAQYLNTYLTMPVAAFEKVEIKRGLDRSADALFTSGGKSSQDVFVLVLTTNAATPKHLTDRLMALERNFYEAREFSEVAAPALIKRNRLNTVFWEPNKITDEKGVLKISFPRPEKNKRVNIVVEGITEDAGAVSVQKTLEF